MKKEGDWMNVSAGEYDEKSGLPKDRSYLECGLLGFLQESLEQMKEAWKLLDAREDYLQWNCDYCSFQSDINVAEVDRLITSEQAWYLREEYLWIERPGADI